MPIQKNVSALWRSRFEFPKLGRYGSYSSKTTASPIWKWHKRRMFKANKKEKNRNIAYIVIPFSQFWFSLGCSPLLLKSQGYVKYSDVKAHQLHSGVSHYRIFPQRPVRHSRWEALLMTFPLQRCGIPFIKLAGITNLCKADQQSGTKHSPMMTR